jgi:S1-C subfamily serine protease
MEELNNRQIVLLTMLVSFVVSTATGIMTVAMLEEAPQTLTQTVNRVVERTIERVVTGTSTPQIISPVTSVTKEVTIYAKEDDLVVAAVEKNQPRIAKIFGMDTATTSMPDAIGFVVSRDGILAADAKILAGVVANKGAYNIMLGEKEYTGTLVEKAAYADAPVAFIRLALASTATLDAVSFGSESTQPKVAQTTLVLGGDYGLGIFKATLTKLITTKSVGTSSPSTVNIIETSPRIPQGYEGSLVVNLDGQAVGIAVSFGEGKSPQIYPASRILSLMTLVAAPTPPAAGAKGSN